MQIKQVFSQSDRYEATGWFTLEVQGTEVGPDSHHEVTGLLLPDTPGTYRACYYPDREHFK